jgi:hypothetical protein
MFARFCLNNPRIGSSNALAEGRRHSFRDMKESNVSAPEDENSQFMKNSVLYKEFLAEREEILKHKWIESEKAGADIGFEKALLDWIVKHRTNWRERRMREARPPKVPA